MSTNRLVQLNAAYRKALGKLLTRRFQSDELIVLDVSLDPSLQHGRVWIKALPETFGRINAKREEIQHELGRLIKLRYTPRLRFLPNDEIEEKLEPLFEQIKGDQRNPRSTQ